MALMLAQGLAGFGIIQWVILAVVLCGVVGILFVVARHTGITIPPWAITIFWIVLVSREGRGIDDPRRWSVGDRLGGGIRSGISV